MVAPLVSIVIPARNAAATLPETLASIAAQTLLDFEAIVVDDGSTDGTQAVVETLSATDPRFRVIPGPATGTAGAARNFGFSHTNPNSQWVSFIDADDLLEPTFLATAVAKGTKQLADIVLVGFDKFDSKTGKVLSTHLPVAEYLGKTTFKPTEIPNRLFQITNPAAWSKLYRTQFLRKYPDLKFPPLHNAEDLVFTYTSLVLASKITVIPKVLVHYRQGDSTTISANIAIKPNDWVTAFQLLATALKKHEIYDTYYPTLRYQVASTGLYQVDNAKTYHHYLTVYNDLVNLLFPAFDITLGAIAKGDWLPAGVKTLQLQTKEQWERGQQSLRGQQSVAAALTKQAQSLPGIPDVSIIIVAHNDAAYIGEAIESALAQTVSVEVIVVDNDSTDGTTDIAKQFAGADPRVLLITQDNSGPSGGRNTGMRIARGRYLQFVDGDDALVPNGLTEVVQIADQDNLDLCVYDVILFRDGATEEDWRRFTNYFSRKHTYAAKSGAQLLAELRHNGEYTDTVWKYLIRREFADSFGTAAHIPVLRHSDALFSFRAFLTALRAQHVPIAVYRHRIRSGSLMRNPSIANINASADGRFAVYVNMLKILTAPPVPLTPFELKQAVNIAHSMFRSLLKTRESIPVSKRTKLVELYRDDLHDGVGALIALEVKHYEDANLGFWRRHLTGQLSALRSKTQPDNLKRAILRNAKKLADRNEYFRAVVRLAGRLRRLLSR